MSTKKIILGWLVLISVFAGAGYYQYNELHKTNAKINALENNISTQQKTLQTFADENTQLKQSLDKVVENQAQPQTVNTIAEVQYLVKLADINLRFRGGISQAIDLLKLADQNLQSTAFEKVRQAIAEDIADLQRIPQVDMPGIYLRLLALNDHVDQLPLLNKLTTIPVAKTETPTESLTWWQKGLHKTGEILRQLVVVRYNPSDKIPLVSPDQHVYLYQNWHMMLLQAMSALTQGQSVIYQSSLQKTMQWVKEYCVADSPLTVSFLNELEQLQAMDIHPSPPTLSRSLQAVNAL